MEIIYDQTKLNADCAVTLGVFDGVHLGHRELLKQVNAESISYTSDNIPNSITVVVQKDKIFIETTAVLDTSSQKQQLQKDLD